MSDMAATRAHIQQTLQEELNEQWQGHPDGNHVITGWVVVVEAIGTDGLKSLSRLTGAPSGGALTDWGMEGLLFNALHSPGWGGES